MTTSDKLREIIVKHATFFNISVCLSDLTAVISEHYVERAKYDEAVDDYMRLLDRYDAMIDNDDDDDIDTDDDLN